MALRVTRMTPGLDGTRRGADDVIAGAGDDAFTKVVDEAKPATVIDVIRDAGLDSLGKKPTAAEIEKVLRKLSASVNGADPLRRGLIRVSAIAALEKAKIPTPARLIDAALRSERPDEDDAQGSAMILTDPEPWPEPVDAAFLLNDLLGAFRKYLVLPSGAAVAFALWILLAYVFNEFAVSPILNFRSATKRAGKTRSLTIASALVPRALTVSNVSTAVVFRVIERYHPTLLLDEADSFLPGNEELRGILNSGHARSAAAVPRTVGEDFEPRLFSTWCPKAVASIGALPETLTDRSIVIEMKRRAPGETVQRLRLDRLAEEFEPLRRKAARWAQDNHESLRQVDPEIPPELSDRAADNWLPLLAIADLCGGGWPDDARWAALKLSGAESESDANIKELLLADLHSIFGEQKADALPTQRILSALGEMENRPWPEWGKYKKPITAVPLGNLLRPFGVSSEQIWFEGENRKGYTAKALTDAWTRYLAPEKSILAASDCQKARPKPTPDKDSSPLAFQQGGYIREGVCDDDPT